MKVTPLVVARIVAWAIALGAVGAVTIGYDSLPDALPVTRWTTAPRTPLIALRVPLINLMTIGLIELLSPGLRRARHFTRSDAVVAILMLTAAAKAGIEAIGILMLPAPFSWTCYHSSPCSPWGSAGRMARSRIPSSAALATTANDPP